MKLFTDRDNEPPIIPGAVHTEDAVHPKCKESCMKGAMNTGCQNCKARFARALANEVPPDKALNAARDELRDGSPGVARIKTETTPADRRPAKRAEPLALASPIAGVKDKGCNCTFDHGHGGCNVLCEPAVVVSEPKPRKSGPVYGANPDGSANPPWKIGPVIDSDSDVSKVDGHTTETLGIVLPTEKRGHKLEIHERQGHLTDANTGVPVVMPDGTVKEVDESHHVAEEAETDVASAYTGIPVVMDDGSVVEINIPRGAQWY